MKVSTFAISLVCFTASVSAFSTSPLFVSRAVAPAQHAVLRMAEDDETTSVDTFKEKMSVTRKNPEKKVSLFTF